MKNFFPLILLALPLLLNGCYTPLIEGAQEGYDVARRGSLEAETAGGDPVAQYKLGDTYCCHGGGPMDQVSVYDNHKATFWYCKSARQGYAPAQLRLAQVYSGDPIHGLHIALRASALVDDVETDPGVALMWARVAANHGGGDDAGELRDKIMAHATDKDRVRAAALMKDWQSAPCRWSEVFPSSKIKK
jgi:TPR repeat protein